jgi:predicted transcriptional regulator
MLTALIGSETREQALVFIFAREKGYALEIADFYELGVSQVQRQLDLMEAGSILVSHKIGRTRLYEFNPRLFYLAELKALLEKTLAFYPPAIQEDLTTNRRRPRRRNKPL